jgi:DNA-binding MarR family transcriptional regulator
MEGLPKEVSTTVLLTVYRNGKLTMSELYEKTKFSTITILNHVNTLIKAGLLEEEREGNFPKRRVIKVSNEGRRVASLLNLADSFAIGTSELVEMGAKAGRMASYRESIASLSNANVTRDFALAELHLKGLEALSGGLLLVGMGLHEVLKEEGEALRTWSAKLDGYCKEGQKLLTANDIRGSVAVVSKALSEFSGSSALMKKVLDFIREKNQDELVRYVEFLSPK